MGRHGYPAQWSAEAATGVRVAEDSALQPVLLFPTSWTLDYFASRIRTLNSRSLRRSRILTPAVDA